MDVFEEYKLFVESTQFLSERRQSGAQTYLTLNTALFAALAFLVRDVGLRSWALELVSLPILMLGIVICCLWERMVLQYKQLISWRYEQLKLIESKPEMAGSHQFYQREAEAFYRAPAPRQGFGFSRLERHLPRLFLYAYVLYGVGIVVLAALGYI